MKQYKNHFFGKKEFPLIMNKNNKKIVPLAL